jgi:hypothetical protein
MHAVRTGSTSLERRPSRLFQTPWTNGPKLAPRGYSIAKLTRSSHFDTQTIVESDHACLVRCEDSDRNSQSGVTNRCEHEKREKPACCPPIVVPGRAERQQGLRLRGSRLFYDIKSRSGHQFSITSCRPASKPTSGKIGLRRLRGWLRSSRPASKPPQTGRPSSGAAQLAWPARVRDSLLRLYTRRTTKRHQAAHKF